MFCLHFCMMLCWGVYRVSAEVGACPETLSPSRREMAAGRGLARVATVGKGVYLQHGGRGQLVVGPGSLAL